METVILASLSLDHYGLGQPLWLLGLILLIPIVWLGRRRLEALGPVRRWTAIALRCAGVIVLCLLLARLVRVERTEDMTLIAVIDHLLKNLVTLGGGVISIYFFGDWVIDAIKSAFKKELPEDDHPGV